MKHSHKKSRIFPFLMFSFFVHGALFYFILFSDFNSCSQRGIFWGEEGNVRLVMFDFSDGKSPGGAPLPVIDAEGRVINFSNKMKGEKLAVPSLEPGKTKEEGYGEKAGLGNSPAGFSGSPDILGKIRQKILGARQYPRQARERRLEGFVSLLFSVNPDGSLKRAQINHSSGETILDDAALATLKRGAPYPFYQGEISLVLKFDLEE